MNQNANNKENVDVAVIDNEDDYKKSKTVMELLLENHNEMPYEQIRDEIMTVIFGNY